MKALSPSLAQKLDGGVTTLAQAWRLTRADGVVVSVTQHDNDLTCDGTVFGAAHSFLAGDHEREINLAPDRTALSGALNVAAISQADLALGRWDGARVEAFDIDWTHPADFIAKWEGRVAGAAWQGHVFELDIVGPETVLNRDLGRVYARTCDAALGDARCKVDLSEASRALTTTIAAVTSDRAILIDAPTGLYARAFIGGVLRITTGPASGWIVDIVGIDVNVNQWRIAGYKPFPVAPLSGNEITFTMGCDKTFATCKARFANGLNFRGQPTLPGDDVAFGGPGATGNDGGRR